MRVVLPLMMDQGARGKGRGEAAVCFGRSFLIFIINYVIVVIDHHSFSLDPPIECVECWTTLFAVGLGVLLNYVNCK